MSTLYGRKPAETFGSLLKVRKNTDNISGVTLPGVTSTLSAVEDGLGNATPLKVSSSRLAFNDLIWPTTQGAVGSILAVGENGQLEWKTIESTTVASSVPWSGVTNTPTTRAGYGITDVQPLDSDLTAIAGLNGTSGLLKKMADGIWSLDTNTYITSASLSSYAPLASPVLTGTPTAPTASAGTNNTQLATTAFVAASFAKTASPTLTGVPTAPTANLGTNTTQIATTAFVDRLRSLMPSSSSSTASISDRGALISISGGFTIPANIFAANDTFSIYNNSNATVTIAQGAGLTLRQVGTANTGNRSLAQRGLVTVVFISPVEAVISGGGLT